MASWSGFHYDGRTAHREPVTVSVTATGLHLARADRTDFLWPYAEVRRAGGTGAGQVRFELTGETGEALLVTGTDILEVIADVSPPDAARLRKVRGTVPTARVLGWSIATVVILAAAYIWGVPVFATWVAPRVPASWEQQLGEAAVRQMAPPEARCTDSAQAAGIRLIVNRLVAAAPPQPVRFTVTVSDDTVVNAFAAPGGQLVINLGLLRAAKSPEELAGVLAHEMQHVLHHHPTRSIVRRIPLQIAAAVISGGDEGMASVVQAAGTLGALRYQRGDELEADADGMRLIQGARIDPRGTVDFMRWLGRRRPDAPQIVSYLSTHPHTEDRIARLEALAAEATFQPVPLMTDAAWRGVTRACRSTP